MNILIRGVDSLRRYQNRILDEIRKEIKFDKCVIISRNNDGKDRYPKDIYLEIPYQEALKEHKVNYKNIVSVPEDILYKMNEFEPRIFETMIREYLVPIFTFEECKKKYFEEIIYWYSIITNNKIDVMIFHNAPHFFHDYLIYCLGKCMNIPTLLFMPTFFPGRMEWGTEYEYLGNSVGKRYLELVEKDESPRVDDDLMVVYHKYRNGFERENFKKVNSNYRKMYEFSKKTIKYVDKDVVAKRRKILIGNMIKSSNLEEKKKNFNKLKKDITTTERCNEYIRNNIVIEKYNKYEILTKNKLEEKYIYFGIQCSPESSLMPKMPVFYDQKHMVLILAKAAKNVGIQLYVKEHWNQVINDKELYDLINGLENVHIFGPNESNIDLMKNSIAVATGSGSCIMEGMFNNIPAIVFGDGSWNDAPGVYRVHDEEQCTEILNKVLHNKEEISDKNILYYLQAVSEETIKMNLFQHYKLGCPFSDNLCIESVSDFIVKWIKEYVLCSN